MKILGKIVLCILSALALIYLGLFLVIFAASTSSWRFYMTLAVIIPIIMWLFSIVFIWGLFKPKVRYISFGIFTSIIILSISGVEINSAYHNSIDQVSDQEIDLTLYEPFRENTKVSSLNEVSTLKLTDNLPRIDGATALYPLYSAFVRAVYPEKDYYVYRYEKGEDDVICTTTEGSYRRLIKGETDMIFVAGPSKEQIQMAKDANVELKLTPIGREAFVFFVNAKNPISELSISEIKKIYSGEVKNWSEFGGKDVDIKAFQRPQNSGSQTTLINFMGDTPLMDPPAEEVMDFMRGIMKSVSSYKNYNSAIGYSFLYYATEMSNENKIKLLSLDGVAPTRENVGNGIYPYSSEFYAVTAGTENPNVEKFIQWILSEQGQYLVNQTGYTSLIQQQKTESEDKMKKAEYRKITQTEAKEMMSNDVIILDVRTQEEFDSGHIKNAILVPDFEIKEKIESVITDKEKTVLVYCRSGNRSQGASKALIEMGYTNVFDFGGINEWTGEIVK